MISAGFIHGTGAAINCELGWIPDWVRLVNLTDGDDIWENFLGHVIVFTSGGTTEIKKGQTITGLTNTSTTGVLREVILDSGTWAGGDAAGWFIMGADDENGAFGSENVEVAGSGNLATVALQNEDGIDIDTEVAATTTDATGIQSYSGDAANNYAKGFTVGSTVSENGKLFGFLAVRNGPGESQPVRVAGSTQAEAVW